MARTAAFWIHLKQKKKRFRLKEKCFSLFSRKLALYKILGINFAIQFHI